MVTDPRALLGATVKSLIAFSHVVLQDLGDRCSVSTSRDAKTVTARTENEGLSFLGITLSKFGKDFQKSLDRGFVDHDDFAGFQRSRGLPRFLGGFLDLVFCRETGVGLDSPSIAAISALHQFTMMWAKIEIPCSDTRIKAAYAGYIECEQELRASDLALPADSMADFVRIGRMLFRGLFSELDRQIWNLELTPKHGPGKTAERLSSNSKYSQSEWTERLDRVFPLGDYLFPNPGWYQYYQDVQILEPGNERPVRVITVPKTLKAPRIIAIEPTCMQYTQQAILESITEYIHGDDLLRSILGWLDRTPNMVLAQQGSRDGTLATLDLSEASDRVSNQQVRALLANWPHLFEAVDACRSRKADVDGHGEIRLAKFASMGSALTFAMEGIVFTTLVFLGIEKALNTTMTPALVREFMGRVRVFGDDIIIPEQMTQSVIDSLEMFGLKVNRDKSFWTGKFRESCGGDYYDGHDISLVRVRQLFPTSRKQHVSELVATVSLRNHLFDRGMEKAVEYLDGIIMKVIPYFPEVPRTSQALGRWSHEPITAQKTCPNYHRPMIRASVVHDTLPSDPLDGRGALMKSFLKRGDLPFVDRKHLERAGRPQTSCIKSEWIYI
jgi:hypothetical protein